MTILKYIFSFIMVSTVFLAVILIGMGVREVRYDCRLAEFHPDYPPEVRQQCRNMFRQNYEQNQK